MSCGQVVHHITLVFHIGLKATNMLPVYCFSNVSIVWMVIRQLNLVALSLPKIRRTLQSRKALIGCPFPL